jgi:hypothetical protein
MYQPSGFVDKDDFQEANPDANCKSLGVEPFVSVGMVDTGSLKLQIGLRPYVLDPASAIDPQDAEISKQLQLMQKTSSSYSNNLVSTLRESSPRPKRALEASLSAKKRAKVVIVENKKSELGLQEQDVSDVLLLTPKNLGLMASQELKPTSLSTTTLVHLKSDKLARILVHCYALQNGRNASVSNMFDPDDLAAGKVKRFVRSDDINCTCGDDRVTAEMVSINLF